VGLLAVAVAITVAVAFPVRVSNEWNRTNKHGTAHTFFRAGAAHLPAGGGVFFGTQSAKRTASLPSCVGAKRNRNEYNIQKRNGSAKGIIHKYKSMNWECRT
jgi:hypothetical protein